MLQRPASGGGCAPTHPQPSFETFVVTRSTADALAPCRRGIDGISERTTLCLLHGPSGSGKTHLLRAATAEARRRGCRVRERTADELREWLVECIRRESKLLPASSYLRDIEFLVVDDLQLLASHPASQDAIAGVFRRAVARSAAVLAASCVAPRALPAFTRAVDREPGYRQISLAPLDGRGAAPRGRFPGGSTRSPALG